jgi:hypothetical protein
MERRGSVGFYELVPKDFVENLRYRVSLRKQCERDPVLREACIAACREDILFFFNAFCWLHEPRPRRDSEGRVLPQVIPFITWPHQDPVIRTIRENLGFRDIGIEKSRGEGMSWIAILTALHDWLFATPGSQMVSIGIVSRTMEFADTPSDINSLLPKMDWELERLPVWMAGVKGVDYVRRINEHTILNTRNKSLISAYASTGEVGSGGRYKYWIIDELSKFPAVSDEDAMTSTQATTDSRLIIGTPYGDAGAYHDIMHKASSLIKLTLAWEDNPTKNRGLYRLVNGTPVAADPVSNPLPENYNPPSPEILELFKQLRANGFRLENRLRSPWYDSECNRTSANPYNIAQELDRDYGGSLYRIFTEDFTSQARESIRNPFSRATVMYDDSLTPAVNRASDGNLLLWMALDAYGRPPKHPYIIGVDVCTGLGGSYTSNSAIEIIDALTMEQVGELTSNIIAPDNFADLTVAICNWLGNAYLAWERNGPGSAYTARIKEIGYPNVYLRTKLFDKRRRKKIKEPGWWTDTKSKEVLFSEMKRAIATGELKLRSEDLVKECGQYIRIGKAIEHVSNARDKTGGPDSGENHGDRVIAMGIAIQALRDRPAHVVRLKREAEIKQGSIEERDLLHRELSMDVDDDWDERTTADLMRGASPGRVRGRGEW